MSNGITNKWMISIMTSNSDFLLAFVPSVTHWEILKSHYSSILYNKVFDKVFLYSCNEIMWLYSLIMNNIYFIEISNLDCLILSSKNSYGPQPENLYSVKWILMAWPLIERKMPTFNAI